MPITVKLPTHGTECSKCGQSARISCASETIGSVHYCFYCFNAVYGRRWNKDKTFYYPAYSITPMGMN